MVLKIVSASRNPDLLQEVLNRLRAASGKGNIARARKIYQDHISRGQTVVMSLAAVLVTSRVYAAGPETDDITVLPIANSLEDLLTYGEICLPGLKYGLASEADHNYEFHSQAHENHIASKAHSNHGGSFGDPFASRFVSKYSRDHGNQHTGHDAEHGHSDDSHGSNDGHAGHQAHSNHQGHGSHTSLRSHQVDGADHHGAASSGHGQHLAMPAHHGTHDAHAFAGVGGSHSNSHGSHPGAHQTHAVHAGHQAHSVSVTGEGDQVHVHEEGEEVSALGSAEAGNHAPHHQHDADEDKAEPPEQSAIEAGAAHDHHGHVVDAAKGNGEAENIQAFDGLDFEEDIAAQASHDHQHATEILAFFDLPPSDDPTLFSLPFI